MKIHAYEKLWLVASMVLIVGFILTITYGSVGLGITMIGDDESTIAPDDIGDDDRFGEPRVEQVGEDEYEAYVIAQTWIFQPDPIEVPADSEVTFYVTSSDVVHGFSIPGTNINTMVIPGEIAQLTVEFNEPGEYGIICNEYCGAGHHDMESELIVQPEDEFDLTELTVEAPESVEPGADVELTATIENGEHEPLETTVDTEISNETIQQDITVEGDSTENISITVDSEDLDEGDHDWTVSVDGYEETGTVTVEPQGTGGNETDSDGDGDDSADNNTNETNGGGGT
ncbi:cupredoxin domain-containing protein (plasmid) [Natrinema zhouii]|uniref:cupredoxin domain-containing protein n=1 Tax=Natrinema zhouii TaxID=1710539 RepID=UPI001CFFE310|nr:cytochrome c oxidase subunit II [Natrinema zhouii]UHQ98045.1 cupredoxin domain-containing protein [Natrinema zhouii]